MTIEALEKANALKAEIIDLQDKQEQLVKMLKNKNIEIPIEIETHSQHINIAEFIDVEETVVIVIDEMGKKVKELEKEIEKL